MEEIRVGRRYWFYNESFWDNREVKEIDGEEIGFPNGESIIWRNKKDVFCAYWQAIDSVRVEPKPVEELRGCCKNCGAHGSLTSTGLYGFNLCSNCYQKYIR